MPGAVQAVQPKLITQDSLELLLALEKEHQTTANAINQLREYITKVLEEGGQVEQGAIAAYLETSPGRKSVSWKKVVIRLKGEAYAKRVLAATKPGPSRTELVVG